MSDESGNLENSPFFPFFELNQAPRLLVTLPNAVFLAGIALEFYLEYFERLLQQFICIPHSKYENASRDCFITEI